MTRFLAIALCAVLASPALAQEGNKNAPRDEQRFNDKFVFPVGNFSLTERSGKNITANDLRGSIWVAHFFYPGCSGVCTRTTPNMKRLQEIFRGKPYVRFVSIALNSDTPETLQRYANNQNADPDQWLFLTDKDDAVLETVQRSFFNIAYRNEKPTPGNEISHSSNLVLIDPNGLIAGFVEGDSPHAVDILKDRIERLRLAQPIPIRGADLPWFNAMLNATCTILLLLGWIAIRMRFVTLHKIVMLLALLVSAIFLSSYLFYHFAVLGAEPMRFRGEGAARYAYFTILLTHTVLAVVVAPLAMYITVQGLRNALPQHVRMARWTLPIWLYVSVTGVVVYLMLYRVEW